MPNCPRRGQWEGFRDGPCPFDMPHPSSSSPYIQTQDVPDSFTRTFSSSDPKPAISRRTLVLLNGEWYLETEDLGNMFDYYHLVSSLLCPLRGQRGKKSVSTHPFTHPSTHPFIHPPTHPPTRSSIHLFIYVHPSISCLSIHPPAYLSICSPICPFIHPLSVARLPTIPPSTEACPKAGASAMTEAPSCL